MKTVNAAILLTVLVLIADLHHLVEAKGCGCEKTEKFVCGSNHLSYKNACELKCCTDGTVTVAYEGQCKDEDFDSGCPVRDHELCGSDGITYISECHARHAGVCIKSQGAC